MFPIFTRVTQSYYPIRAYSWYTIHWNHCEDVIFVVIDGTACYRFDDPWYYQWPHSCHYDNSRFKSYEWSVSTLAQVMACCLTTLSHYPKQCWLIISEAHTKIQFTTQTSGVDSVNETEILCWPGTPYTNMDFLQTWIGTWIIKSVLPIPKPRMQPLKFGNG